MSPLRVIALTAGLTIVAAGLVPTFGYAQKAKEAVTLPKDALRQGVRKESFAGPLTQAQKLDFLRSSVKSQAGALAMSVRSLDRPIRLIASHPYEAGRAYVNTMHGISRPNDNEFELTEGANRDHPYSRLEIYFKPSHAPQAVLLEVELARATNFGSQTELLIRNNQDRPPSRSAEGWELLTLNWRSSGRAWLSYAALVRSTQWHSIEVAVYSDDPGGPIGHEADIASITLTPAR